MENEVLEPPDLSNEEAMRKIETVISGIVADLPKEIELPTHSVLEIDDGLKAELDAYSVRLENLSARIKAALPVEKYKLLNEWRNLLDEFSTWAVRIMSERKNGV